MRFPLCIQGTEGDNSCLATPTHTLQLAILYTQQDTDFKRRVWKDQWFINYAPLVRILAGYEFTEGSQEYIPDKMFSL